MLRQSRNINQAGLLLLSTLSGIVTQVIINALLARLLSQEEYGNYSYFINLFILCQTIFNFGFFYTICRFVSISKNDYDIRVYYYEGLKFLGITALIMVVSLYIFSFAELEDLKRNGIESVLWIIAPLSCVYLITNYNEQIFQGNNKIVELSISRAVPKIIYAFLIVIIFALRIQLSILPYLTIYLCCHLIVYAVLIQRMRPIVDSESRFKTILKKNKEFGLNIYIGSLLSVGVASLMGLIISNSCTNNIVLGYYNIALQITTPLTLIPNILSTVLFSSFSKNGTLSSKIIICVILISVGLYSVLFVLSDFIIQFIFGAQYLPASELIKILGFGSVLYGIADFFNRFILAKGKAVAIRNIAVSVGITYLIIGILLIPKQLAVGASYAKVLTGIIYLVLEAFYTKFLIPKGI